MNRSRTVAAAHTGEEKIAEMFLGHIGVGLGLKSAAPRMSLGTLLLASLFIDLLWPTLLLLGFEQVEISPGDTRLSPLSFTEYPFSHSLLAAVFWSTLFVGVAYLIRRSRRDASVCGIAVFSHWLLDLIVHQPDLQLMPGLSTRVGFGLWNSLPATLVTEFLILAVGLGLYYYTSKAADLWGHIGFWGMIMLIVVIYLWNVFGPPPPNTRAIAWVGQAQWLIVLWGYWIEKHRPLRWLYN